MLSGKTTTTVHEDKSGTYGPIPQVDSNSRSQGFQL